MKMYKCGDILFCKSDSAMSKTILTAIKGNWSHTAQVIDIHGQLFVIDAQAGGVMPRRIEHWEAEFNYHVDILRPQEVDVKDWSLKALHYSGIKYDKVHLITGLWKSLIGAEKINTKFQNNGRFICFEYTAKLLNMVNPEQQTARKIFDYLLLKNYTGV